MKLNSRLREMGAGDFSRTYSSWRLLPARKAPLTCLSTGVLIAVLALLAPLSGLAEKVDQLKAQGYVNDFANILASQTSEQITALCYEVDQKTRAQIAVVTIQSLEGLAPEEFANKLFARWGVGYKDNNRGILILLAKSDRKYRVEVGYGLEPILPDGKVGGFGREMVPILKQGDYNRALLHLTRQIAGEIARDRGVSLEALSGRNTEVAGTEAPSAGSGGPSLPWLFLLLILFGAGLFWWWIPAVMTSGYPARGRRFRGGGGWWSGGGNFGGFGGGGGFGGFGGGMSGGGGAGGSW